MRRPFLLLLLLATGLGAQTPPDAPLRFVGSLCDAGADPAASLLVPYFEVDSQNDAGLDTLVGIVNIADDPIVAHITVWNVDSWAVFTFNIYLTGNDVCTFSMRQLLVFGNFPNNGCASGGYRFRNRYVDCDGDGRYFDDAWTVNDGLLSLAGTNWDVACYAAASAAVTADWQCKLSVGSYDGWNSNYVGYLTVDASITCTGGQADRNFWPWFEVNYLDTDGDGRGDHGALENSNVLMGDIFYYDQTVGESDGIPAVHLEVLGEANVLPGHTWGFRPADMERWGVNTFWYKYEHHAGLPPNDLREALPVRWAFRHSCRIPPHPGLETEVDIWRSGNIVFDHHWAPGGPCVWAAPVGAAWTMLYDPAEENYGLPLAWYMPRDDEGRKGISSGGSGPWLMWNAYLATQRLEVDIANGWALADWDGWIDIRFDVEQDYWPPGFGSTFDQSWVTVRYEAFGKFTVSATATATLGGCALKVDDATGQLYPAPTH